MAGYKIDRQVIAFGEQCATRGGNSWKLSRVALAGSGAFSCPPGSTLCLHGVSVRLEPCCAVRREATECTRSFFFHAVSAP